MNTNQITLTREQMNHLKELGVNITNASMYQGRSYGHYIDSHSHKDEIYADHLYDWFEPVYTFDDVIRNLPKCLMWKEKDTNTFLTILYDNSDGCVIMYCTDNVRDVYHSEGSNDQLDAAYKMLCWIMEKKN